MQSISRHMTIELYEKSRDPITFMKLNLGCSDSANSNN
ncbi:hypothetical protein CSB95_4927 [Pseudomonas aeruginosa]|nr:hypothetical protein CSC29_0857 [Pseudomonas aeruginosa]PRW10804.1 hypothetical protein CSB95_4927 [Pseudomonas aeruginosa]